jgi:hypothetical protein
VTLSPRASTLLALVCLPALAACVQPSASTQRAPNPSLGLHNGPPEDEAATGATEDPNDPRWRDALLEVAADYRSWGRLEDEGRWAPWLCRMPQPAPARVSASTDQDTHGRKLYTLYALDPDGYGARPGPGAGLARPERVFAQILVKEAWVPEEVDGERGNHFGGWGRSRLAPARGDDGVLYGGDRLAGIFVVARLPDGADTEGTDEGWIYATLSPDDVEAASEAAQDTEWTVTAAGRIPSCMDCHQAVPSGEGRLFGLSEDSPAGRDD